MTNKDTFIFAFTAGGVLGVLLGLAIAGAILA